ncbi:MAG: electron transport complex subunit E [Oscillospiraceae bacterium]
MEKQSLWKVLTNGIIKENPVLVLILGTCPTLAVTTMAKNGLGMGLATTLVLIGSNFVISLLKNIIPDKVRIPSYIVVIAGFVTVVGFLVEAYAPDVYRSLGIFLPLIVVNCIILGRAEMFASKNSPLSSVCDAIGMGLGFTLALFVMGSIREILGAGKWMGTTLTADLIAPIGIIGLAPGGFFIFGCLIALVNKVSKGKAIKQKDFGCSGCPSASICNKADKGGCQ